MPSFPSMPGGIPGMPTGMPAGMPTAPMPGGAVPRPEATSAQLQEVARAQAAASAVNNKLKKEQMIREQVVQKQQADAKKCHLHNKMNKKCKFCQRHEECVNGFKPTSGGGPMG